MNKILFLIILLVFLILKVFNVIYNNKVRNNPCEEIALMSKKISYNKYEKVSKKTSPSNTIQRVKGDFLDFILENDYTDSQSIENNILDIYGEDLA